MITLDAGAIARTVGAVKESVNNVSAIHPDPAILVSPAVRPHLRRMIERSLPRCSVITANELSPDVSVETLGTVAA